MPKALRPFVRHDRRLFAEVSRVIYDILSQFYHEAAGSPLLIGTVIAHQTFGEMLRWSPQFDAIVLEGECCFTPRTRSTSSRTSRCLMPSTFSPI